MQKVIGTLIAELPAENGMNLLRIGVSQYALRTFAALIMYLVAAPQAEAATIYFYEGTNFTVVTGSAPQVSTSNHLSGWVEFASAPLPNQVGKTDWVAYSLTDGARTLSSANGDHQFFVTDFFNFDAALNIIAWQFSLVPDSEVTNANSMLLRHAGINTSAGSQLGGGLVQTAVSFQAGTWTAAAPVPSAPPAEAARCGEAFGAT